MNKYKITGHHFATTGPKELIVEIGNPDEDLRVFKIYLAKGENDQNVPTGIDVVEDNETPPSHDNWIYRSHHFLRIDLEEVQDPTDDPLEYQSLYVEALSSEPLAKWIDIISYDKDSGTTKDVKRKKAIVKNGGPATGVLI